MCYLLRRWWGCEQRWRGRTFSCQRRDASSVTVQGSSQCQALQQRHGSPAQSVLPQLGPLCSLAIRFSCPGKSDKTGHVMCPDTNRCHRNPSTDICWSPTLRSTIAPLAPDAAAQFPWRLWAPLLGWKAKTRRVSMIRAPRHRRCHQGHLLLCVLGAGRVSLTQEDSFWLPSRYRGNSGKYFM